MRTQHRGESAIRIIFAKKHKWYVSVFPIPDHFSRIVCPFRTGSSSRTVVVELIRKIRVYDKKNIEITFDFDDCYQTLLNQLPAMGVDTVIDDDNNLQVKVKEVV